ncbi:MAG: ErfK/YbiS/YcfS/YnhG family protein [Pseudonocardia sp.]|jgi:lipoprotein-anchoring transpeptidase ErfK/SrfK|nr:ErfK/YbiS/YcfS/YnhG family protein [Pseudonocardia sp.]
MGWLNGRARQRLALCLGLLLLVSLGLGLAIAGHPGATHALGSATGTAPDTQAPAPLPRPVASITPADGKPLNPTKPVVVHVENGTASAVTAKDAKTGDPVDGTLASDGTSWTSKGQLAYGSTYAVSVDMVDPAGAPVHQDLSASTLKPSTLAYPSFIPPPNQQTVGVGQPIVVRFNHPVHNRVAAQNALSVTSSPAQTGSWYWLSDTEVHYRPRTYWTAGSTITLKANMFGVDLGNGIYGETDRTETVHVHDAWVAKADGATEQMQIFDNGALVKTMPISLGSPGFPSHVGPHVITDKQPTIIMDSCTYGVCQGQPGYYKEQVDLDLRISNDGEFVHSAPWSVGSQGGANVSHGCVNLSPANAQWFFDHFGIGDVVEITNSGGPQLPLDDTFGDWELTWAQWQKGTAT